MIPVYVYVTLKDFKVSHWLSKVIRVVKQFAMTPAISDSKVNSVPSVTSRGFPTLPR